MLGAGSLGCRHAKRRLLTASKLRMPASKLDAGIAFDAAISFEAVRRLDAGISFDAGI
jgi:hypothetical protein